MSKTRFLLTKSLWSSRMRYLETEVLQIVLQVAPQVCPQGPPILRDTKKALYLGVGRERHTGDKARESAVLGGGWTVSKAAWGVSVLASGGKDHVLTILHTLCLYQPQERFQITTI